MFQIFNGGVVPRLRPRRLGMRRLYAVSVAALLISVPARAHDYWADAETLRPTPGAALDVWVAGGHAFPDAELALSPRLLRKVSLVGPDRRRGAVSVEVAADKRHKGSVALPDAPGVYLLDMVIQNPRHKQPQYVGRALLLAAGDEAPPSAYALGEGLEIVPQASLARWPADGRLPVSVHKDGQPVAAALTVYPAGGKPSTGRSAAERPAIVQVEAGRQYLITTRVGRVGVSLVFQVGEDKGNEKADP
jgi:hypothetical protein